MGHIGRTLSLGVPRKFSSQISFPKDVALSRRAFVQGGGYCHDILHQVPRFDGGTSGKMIRGTCGTAPSDKGIIDENE